MAGAATYPVRVNAELDSPLFRLDLGGRETGKVTP
jgi:hypothetical protein